MTAPRARGRGGLAASQGSSRARLAGPCALAASFFLALFLLRDGYGTTWDEEESYVAGRRNLEIAGEIFAGAPLAEVEWPWHELTGHQLVLDSARAAFAAAAARFLPPSPAPAGERLFNLALSAAALVLVGALVLELTASAALATLATAALALQPKLVAHAQNNPKDLPGLFVFTLGVLALVRAARGATPARAALAAGAIGLAVSTWLPALALVPLAAAVLLAPPAALGTSGPHAPGSRGSASLARRGARAAGVIAGGLLAALALWPWLWSDPLGRALQLAARLAEFPAEFEVLYFGRLHPSSALPLHYTAGSLLVATPLPIALLAFLGLGALARPGGRRALAALALGWIAVLLALDALAGVHYDGVRHVLAVLPAVSLLAALGAERLVAALRRGASRLRLREPLPALAAAAGLLACAAAVAIDLVRMHPHQDAYLSSPFRRLAPAAGERLFEIEYWGHSYRALASWLDREAEPGSTVLAPIAPHCLEPYLRSDLVVRERLRRGEEPASPPYLVFMTRRGWYAPLGLEEVVALSEPLHTVRSPTGALAAIYRPHRIPAELRGRRGPRSWSPPARSSRSALPIGAAANAAAPASPEVPAQR